MRLLSSGSTTSDQSSVLDLEDDLELDLEPDIELALELDLELDLELELLLLSWYLSCLRSDISVSVSDPSVDDSEALRSSVSGFVLVSLWVIELS
jgi:hypothetical protein